MYSLLYKMGVAYKQEFHTEGFLLHSMRLCGSMKWREIFGAEDTKENIVSNNFKAFEIQKLFPDGESNPGRGGESAES